VIFFIISLNVHSQDSLKYFTVGVGAGIINYPEGNIYGFTQSYHFDYSFSNHFGAKLSLDIGDGQNDGLGYFDLSKSTAISVGLVYAPIKNLSDFYINTSFSIFKNLRIIGSKDEIINNNYFFSQFTSLERFTYYGLNLGLQLPIIRKNRFLFASKIDTWASWLKIDAYSLKLIAAYNF
jgi:hypothetical protein